MGRCWKLTLDRAKTRLFIYLGGPKRVLIGPRSETILAPIGTKHVQSFAPKIQFVMIIERINRYVSKFKVRQLLQKQHYKREKLQVMAVKSQKAKTSCASWNVSVSLMNSFSCQIRLKQSAFIGKELQKQ